MYERNSSAAMMRHAISEPLEQKSFMMSSKEIEDDEDSFSSGSLQSDTMNEGGESL